MGLVYYCLFWVPEGTLYLNRYFITLYDVWSSRITLRSGKCSEHARTVGVVVRQGIDIMQSHSRLVA